VSETRFHIKSCARRVALKKRCKTTRKWPIAHCKIGLHSYKPMCYTMNAFHHPSFWIQSTYTLNLAHDQLTLSVLFTLKQKNDDGSRRYPSIYFGIFVISGNSYKFKVGTKADALTWYTYVRQATKQKDDCKVSLKMSCFVRHSSQTYQF